MIPDDELIARLRRAFTEGRCDCGRITMGSDGRIQFEDIAHYPAGVQSCRHVEAVTNDYRDRRTGDG